MHYSLCYYIFLSLSSQKNCICIETIPFPPLIFMRKFFRRSLQVTALSLLFIIPVLSLYAILMENFRLPQVVGRVWKKVFYHLDEWMCYLSDEPAKLAQSVRGSLFWSFSIGDFNLTDPLNLVGHIFGSMDFYLPVLVASLPLILLTALLGRVYCGWVCPADFLFEMGSKLRRLMGKMGVDLKSVSFDRLNKYVLLFVGALFSMALGNQLFSFIYPPAILNREAVHLVFYGSIGIGGVLFFLMLLVEVSLSRRAWCRYFCPGGALWSVLGGRRMICVEVSREICTDCGKCNVACEYGLNPMQNKAGIECNNCGDCIDACQEKGVIGYKFRWPWEKRSGSF